MGRRALLLALAVLILSSGQTAAEQAIIDRLNPGAYARVTHAGELVVSATSGALNIAHISSALHIAGFVPVWAYQSGAWTLAAVHQAGVWNVAHLSAIAHVSLGTQAVYVTQSGAWTTQAAHLAGVPSISQGVQWTVLAHAQQSGSWTVQAAHLAGVPSVSQGVQWSVLAHAQQSGSWTVQSAHQGGQWNIAHIAAALHVAGFIGIRDGLNPTGWARVNHAGQLIMNCETGCGAGGDAVNVFHQSTVRHVSSVTHVLVTQSDRNRLAFHQTDAICLTCSGLVSHAGARRVEGQGSAGTAAGGVLTIQGQTGMTPIRADQNAAPWTLSHLSSVAHVVLTGPSGGHLTGAVHVAGLSNIGSGAPGTWTTSISCHSTLGWHLTGKFGVRALIHLTSTNRNVDQTSWRIYICGFAMWSNQGTGPDSGLATTSAYKHMAVQWSLMEGSGVDCVTAPIALIGQASNPTLMMNHSGVMLISPFPWLSTQVAGNSLCIASSARNAAAILGGTVTYRAGP